ncbi:MAG: aquaporin family protein [Candidatus Obscuribacterales bacterium]|nr:aquaporin family protein [Candidatus Obscuribacterales bacterium]
MQVSSLARSLTAEFIGTAFLLSVVVGSGIMADKLDQGNVAVALLAIAGSTGAVLVALIHAFGSISAHFNPAVTLFSALRKELQWSAVVPYVSAQIAGGIAGVVITNVMFGLPAIAFSQSVRTGPEQWLGEVIATFGLLTVIVGAGKSSPTAVPYSVAAYVTGAIWFTSSTCFANPAVTIGRMLTDTITGIRPVDCGPFVLAQIVGMLCATALLSWLFASNPRASEFDLSESPRSKGKAAQLGDKRHASNN